MDLKERDLPADFCKTQISEVKKLIETSTSFSVIGMPAMGISIFLRFLATRNFAYFIHIDINALPELSKEELIKVLSRFDFPALIKKHKRVVVIFNRFDRLKNEFNRTFFANLRSIRDLDKEKIVMIFTANRSLVEQAPEAVGGGNLAMYSNNLYLAPYSKKDLLTLVKLNSPTMSVPKNYLDECLNLSGGHYQLLQLLLYNDPKSDPITNPAIKLRLAELYKYLNYKERRDVETVALGKKVWKLEPLLVEAGYVTKYRLFSPLFSRFILSKMRMHLPPKEKYLFNILKQNQGNIVPKDTLFEMVWEENQDATDWALNALIYRLRSNAIFQAKGYRIKNYKGLGYRLE